MPTPIDIPKVIAERFESWSRFFRARSATPMLVIGVSVPAPGKRSELIVTTCEDASTADVEVMLVAALAMIRQGKGEVAR